MSVFSALLLVCHFPVLHFHRRGHHVAGVRLALWLGRCQWGQRAVQVPVTVAVAAAAAAASSLSTVIIISVTLTLQSSATDSSIFTSQYHRLHHHLHRAAHASCQLTRAVLERITGLSFFPPRQPPVSQG